MKIIQILLVLFAVFSLSFAIIDPSKPNIFEQLSNFGQMDLNSELKSTLENIGLVFDELSKHTENFIEISERMSVNGQNYNPRERATLTCDQAVANLYFGYANTSCSSYIAQVFSANPSSTALTNYCSICQQNVSALLTAVGNSCPVSVRASATFQTAIFYNTYLCFQVSGTYCATGLLSLGSQVSSLTINSITTSQLNQICTPCNIASVKLLTISGLISVPQAFRALRVFRALCSQIDGQYCAVVVSNAVSAIQPIFAQFASKQLPSASDFNTLMSNICTPCFRVFVGRYIATNPLGANGFPLQLGPIGNLCRRHDKNLFCIVDVVQNAPSALLAVLAGSSPCANISVTHCPSQCQTLVNTLVQNTDCCWGLAGDFAGLNVSTTNALFASCFTTPPPPICPSYSQAVITYIYNNIANSWLSYPGNATAFVNAFLADVGFATQSTPISTVTIVPSKKRDGVVTASVTLQADANSADALTSPSSECDAACSCLQSTYNAAQPVSVSSSSSTNVMVQSGSISSFTINLLVLFSIFAISLLF